jgi:photosystem II stability/assembly factor-like uncharacterized protein
VNVAASLKRTVLVMLGAAAMVTGCEPCGEGWEEDHLTSDFMSLESGTEAELSSVWFRPDEAAEAGIAVGPGGTLLRADPDTHAWQPVESDTSEDLHHVAGVLKEGEAELLRYFVAGSAGTLLRTDDSGATWESVALDTDVDLHESFFGYSGRGVIVGDEVVLASDDFGESWSVVSVPGAYLRSVAGKEGAPDLLAVGRSGTVLRSDDDGWSWAPVEVPTETNLTGVTFGWPENSKALPGVNAVIVGEPATVLTSKDDGKTWETNDLSDSIAPGAFLRDAGEGWIVGTAGTIVYTGVDGWSRLDVEPDVAINDILSINVAGWSSGQKGGVGGTFAGSLGTLLYARRIFQVSGPCGCGL